MPVAQISSSPYADPVWYTRTSSPYYDKSHTRLRDEVRYYVDTHITPFCGEWESNGSIPAEVNLVTMLGH